MYEFITFTLFVIFYHVECATYPRYGDTSYSTQPYQTVSTLNSYNYQANNGGNYPQGSEYSGYGQGSQYPNYKSGYSTSNYNSYSTGNNGNGEYYSGYNTPRYASGYGQGYSPYEAPFMSDSAGYCVNRSPQSQITVDSLMGMWYGVEYIQHLGGDSRVDYARSCIVLHIAEPLDRPATDNQLYHVQHIQAKFRQQYRSLRLVWDEAGQTIEYSLYFRNDSAGYWQAHNGQNGTLTMLPHYQQFSGTVQVLKAVNDHLVLNFCQQGINGRSPQLYSVLFSREPGAMAQWEIDSVHTLLQNKKLSVASRRMVCGNGADRLYAALFSIMACLLAYAIGGS